MLSLPLRTDALFVDVWRGQLPMPEEAVFSLSLSLSEAEQQRAAQYRTTQLQQRYQTGRGLIRRVLAAYLDTSPSTIGLHQDAYGKPQLSSGELSFNLSHSHDQIALAVSNLNCIGLDVEVIRPRNNLKNLAQHCLSDQEWRVWQSLPHDQQLSSFYRLWTIKEAFVKACGRGLAAGLSQCSVDMNRFQNFTQLPEAYGSAEQWCIAHSHASEQECLAVVVPQATVSCRFLNFDQIIG